MNVHAIDYLHVADTSEVPPVCVVYGDEPFLKREVLAVLRRHVLGDGDGEYSLESYSGSEVEAHEVFDAVATLSLFGSDRRMVLVEQADDFVKRHRADLEVYAESPAKRSVLVLDVKSWAKTTRLFKQLAKTGLQVECKPPTGAVLRSWLAERAKTKHAATLELAAVDRLMELIDPDLGLLDQELTKLALVVGPSGTIDEQLVTETVGNWRTRSIWELIDAAVDGNARDALSQLDRLLLAGEQPIGLMAQIGSTLRRFAAATMLVEQANARGTRRPSLGSVLAEAGFPKFVVRKAERQLRQLSRDRGRQLYRWLLAADLALKGPFSTPIRARHVLEELIVRLSSSARPHRPS